MIVRCGRCQTELEVAGAGEFACPACGTRNVVRGSTPRDPYDLSSLGPAPVPPKAEPEAAPPVVWVACPSCHFRFAAGDAVLEVRCPNCETALTADASGDWRAEPE